MNAIWPALINYLFLPTEPLSRPTHRCHLPPTEFISIIHPWTILSLLSSEMTQKRRHKREEPVNKGPESSTSWMISTWETVGLTRTKQENRWDMSIFFQTRVSGPWVYLTSQAVKHTTLVETFYLISLRSHIALILFIPPFTFLLEVFPWVESIFKAFCLPPPRICALTLDALVDSSKEGQVK